MNEMFCAPQAASLSRLKNYATQTQLQQTQKQVRLDFGIGCAINFFVPLSPFKERRWMLGWEGSAWAMVKRDTSVQKYDANTQPWNSKGVFAQQSCPPKNHRLLVSPGISLFVVMPWNGSCLYQLDWKNARNQPNKRKLSLPTPSNLHFSDWIYQ